MKRHTNELDKTFERWLDWSDAGMYRLSGQGDSEMPKKSAPRSSLHILQRPSKALPGEEDSFWSLPLCSLIEPTYCFAKEFALTDANYPIVGILRASLEIEFAPGILNEPVRAERHAYTSGLAPTDDFHVSIASSGARG